MSKSETIRSMSLVKAPQQKSAVKAATPFFIPVIQPKLTINEPNDVYEQEADATADKIMRMTDHEVLQSRTAPAIIQTKCADCEAKEQLQADEQGKNEEEPVQLSPVAAIPLQRKCAECEAEEDLMRKCAECEEKVQLTCATCEENEKVQRACAACEEEVLRKESGVGIAPTPAVYQTIQSAGIPLEAGIRSFMESRFNRDFSEVQVHDDGLAHRSAKEINARAYTHGNHIVFAAGEYQPHTQSGKQLLAHELTHTLQQAGVRSKVQRDEADECYGENRVKPEGFSRGTGFDFFSTVKKEGKILDRPIDFLLLIAGNTVYLYNTTDLIGKYKFERKSSPNLEGYFINYESDLSLAQLDDSWHFVCRTTDGLKALRLIPRIRAYTERNVQDNRHNLSREFFDLLSDFSKKLDLISLSTFRHENVYNVGVVVMATAIATSEGGGIAAEKQTKPAPTFIFILPAWLSQAEKSIKDKIAKIKQSNPDDQSLPSGFKFYTTDIIREQEGEGSWRLRVDNGEEKKYIKIYKKDWDKAEDKEDFAEAILNRMIGIVTDQNRSKAAKQFDEQEAAENKVKTAKGSQFAGLFKLRDNIWKVLETLKKAQPSATDIPDKLTLEFYGDTGSEKGYFKIWLQEITTPGKIEFSGSTIDKQVSVDDDITEWVVLLRQQTAINRLVLSGTDPKEFINWENEAYNSNASVQLAPFPAEIIPKNLNPDFTTVKGASNEFVMSLNWSAIYGVRDNLSIASILFHVRKYYVFMVLDLPPEIVKMKAEYARPDELKKASEEHVKKNEPVKPYKKSYDTQRDSDIDISMDSEGSFLLASYATVKHPDDKAGRATSIAAHPYFVTEINALADKTVLDMDVVASLRKRLENEKDAGKRKLLEDQIQDIEKRQSRGYASQAREDIGDIDKLITQANALLEFIKEEDEIGSYNGDVEFDPFPIRVARKRPELVPIYKLIKDKTNTYSFSQDESLTISFIQTLKNEKKDLGKLEKRVSTPKGDFKGSATKYKALAVSVNEDNGRVVPVMLLIGEHKNSNPSKNRYKHIIFDVTTDAYDEDKMLYAGDEKSSEAESVNSAFVKFGEDNNYGDGKVAYRVPALGYTGTVRSYKTLWEWIEKAMMVLVFVLLAFGVILSGGGLGPLAFAVLSGLNTILGVSAGILGAVMAIRSMANRREKGTLEMNAQTSMDILNIIGGFTGTLTTAAKFANTRISGSLLAVYEVTEFSGNVYLVHAKLQEDMAAIKNLNLTDPNDVKQLMEQAYAEAEQQGAMLLTSVVAGKLFQEGEGEILKEEDLPPPAKEKIENTGYKSYKDKGWVNEAGEVTDNAPPFLRKMAKAATEEPTTTPSEQTPAKQESSEPGQEPVTKPKGEAPTVSKPAETPDTTGEHTTVDPQDARAHKDVKIRNKDHEVVVTKDAIGLCSPECPILDFKYKQELIDNPLLAERNRQINLLRKSAPKKAAELAAALVPELESARAKKIKFIAPETTPAKEPMSTEVKATEKPGDPSGEPIKPTEPPSKTPTDKPELEPNSPAARKEAEEWELIAHDSDQSALKNRRLAEDEQAKAERLRKAGHEEEAKLAERTAAAAGQQAAREAKDAHEARREAGKLRGGKEGLSGEHIIERDQLQEKATQLKDEIKGKKPALQARRDEIQTAKDKLVERRDALIQLELNRRTENTREWRLTRREYEAELQAAKDRVASMQKSIDAKEEAFEREVQPVREAQRKLNNANDRLHDLDKLDKGLSEDNNNAKGDFAEARATQYYADRGIDKIGGHSDKRQGIDGIYTSRNPPPLGNIVAEIKYVDDATRYLNNPDQAMKDLLEKTVKGHTQLSDKWIKERLQGAFKNDAEKAAEFTAQGFTKVLLIYNARTRQFLPPIIVP